MLLQENIELWEPLNVVAFTEKLARQYYPDLSEQLQAIEDLMQKRADIFPAAKLSILANIKQELNCIRQKEQMILFPALTILEQQGKSTDCKLFKIIKTHYTTLLSSLQELKQLLRTNNAVQDLQLLDQVNILEASCIRLQKVKEKFLFSRFKNCEGSCKNI